MYAQVQESQCCGIQAYISCSGAHGEFGQKLCECESHPDIYYLISSWFKIRNFESDVDTPCVCMKRAKARSPAPADHFASGDGSLKLFSIRRLPATNR